MAMDYPPGDRKPFADGRREWEPEDEDAFRSADPLNPEHYDWRTNFPTPYHAGIEFAAWSHLPALLRGQAWRERELAAFLRSQSYWQRWGEQPALIGFEQMAIGRRPWETVGPPGIGIAMAASDRVQGYREALCGGNHVQALYEYNQLDKSSQQLLRWDPLAIVLRFQETIDRSPGLYDDLHLDSLLSIESRIEPLYDYGLHELVPVVLEVSRNYFLRGASVSQVLQGGQSIYRDKKIGIGRTKQFNGTLTCIVEYSYNGQEYEGLLAPQHVLGDTGEYVFQNGVQVGEVVCSDSRADVALAELNGNLPGRPEILNRNLHPAAPLTPVSGMPAEYYGAKSQTIEESYIGLVYIQSPAFYNLGQAPTFEMEGSSRGGDSGALVLSGHNQQDAKSPNLARYFPSLTPDQLPAILGMLVAGDDSRKNCLMPEVIFATPASDIYAALFDQGFKIRWLTR